MKALVRECRRQKHIRMYSQAPFHLRFFILFVTSITLNMPNITWSLNHNSLIHRRSMFEGVVATGLLSQTVQTSPLLVVTDPKTYSALYYAPPQIASTTTPPPPLILVLHGAGLNNLDIRSDLADPQGEHAGLIPSLIASGGAPPELLTNFAVLAPYSQGKTSFYEDSRTKMLDFLDWAVSSSPQISFDPNKIFLFGFSDGATVAVELMTTRRFIGGVICSYGFSGKTLPSKAIDRLKDLPMWVFHSKDDVIFDVVNSDRLVSQAKTVSPFVRYSRYDQDPENLPKRVRGHSMGITASKMPQVYDWMRQIVDTPTL